MNNPPVDRIYENISQRAVSPFQKALAGSPSPGSRNPSATQEQQDLAAFFRALYADLYARPDRFGLPLTLDASIAEYEPNAKEKKQAVKRRLDKPRKLLTAGLDFLMLAGVSGRPEDSALYLDDYPALLRQSGVKARFLAGLEAVGLAVVPDGNGARLSSARFPVMLPALQALAICCAAYPEPGLGKFLFISCDFRALDGYRLQALDLYSLFDEPGRQVVADLDAYFSGREYKAEVGIHAPFAWNVKYQGDRKVKATPLFEVNFDDRYARALRMQIKPASAGRLAAALPEQPQLLQDDFLRRANLCQGDKCRWCRNQKTLGPATIVLNGEARTYCWYTPPDIHEIDENTVELVRQYEQMHAGL